MPKNCISLSPEHICVGNTLISLHVSHGQLAKAQEICDRLEARDVVSWNALIAGYSQHNHGEKALSCLMQMRHESLCPNAITYVCTLKACGSIGAAPKTKQLHAGIWQEEALLETNVIVGTALVDAYAKCEMLAESQQVFDQLQTRNAVSWNVLIAGYAKYGHGEEAILCYEQMQLEGVHPNAVTFLYLLKACGRAKAIEKGEVVHAEILRQGFVRSNAKLGTALVDMYAKCGALAKAEEMFNFIHFRNLFSWSVLIEGYIQQGQGENALNCFEQMQCEGTLADAVTLVCILKACCMLDSLHKGTSIHAVILQQGFLDVLLGSGLLDMYAKFGELEKAQEVFNQIPNPNVVCWTVLIAAYTQHGLGEKGLFFFAQMQEKGLTPDALTYVCALNACGSIAACDKGKEIHDEIIKGGLVEKYTPVSVALVDMYAKCGILLKAKEVFDNLCIRDVVSWTALVAGYAQHGYCKEALDSFQQMQHEGHSPNVSTYVCILKACGEKKAINEGKEIHAKIVKEGFLVTNILVGNALVDMYAKFAILEKAQEVFDQLPVRDIISWNVLIAAYVQQGSGQEGLNHFWKMHTEGIVPDVTTYLCILKACGNIGCLNSGENIHFNIFRDGLLQKDSLLSTALVDMYVKCGSLTKAHEVFNQFTCRDVITWTALITGYAQFGKDEIVVDLFNKMIQEGLQPDAPMFTVVLNACSHSGLLEKGEIIFKTLFGDYGIIPTLAHHTCMVDLFCRAGHLDKAVVILLNMPTFEYLPAWVSLLSGCIKCRNVKLGEVAFEYVVRLNETHPSTYVCMGNIYAAAAM